MSRSKPNFVLGTGAVIVMFITLICLGFWQVERLKWKNGLIQKISDVNPRTFTPIEEFIVNFSDFEDIELHKVRLSGNFHHDLSIVLIPRTWNGINGGHLYTPMTLSASEHTILVNRGWVPADQDGIHIQKPEGQVEVLCYIQEPALPGWLTPDNVIENKAWYYLDLDAVQEEITKNKPSVGQKMLPFYAFVRGESKSNDYPKPLDPLLMVRNNHLGYAVTWFSLAFALLIMYIFYVRKHKE